MIITKEISLSNFEFWSGAVDTAKQLNYDDFNTIEDSIVELYPDGCDETTINDIFWFEEDWIAQMLGYNDWEDLQKKRDPEYVDPDERRENIKDKVCEIIEGKVADYTDYDLEDWLDDNWDEDSDDEVAVHELADYIIESYQNDDEDDDE